MSFKLLEVVFQVGKILAMSPWNSETKTVHFPSLPYAFFVTGIYSVGLFISAIYRYPVYVELSSAKFTVQVLLDASLYLINIGTILTAVRKKSEWRKLLLNLKITHHKSSENAQYLRFVIANLVYVVLSILEGWVYGSLMGLDFVKQYAIEYLQMYSQFILYFLLYVVLKMLLMRYEYITRFTSEFGKRRLLTKDYFWYLQKIKCDICFLRETSDLINNIFGWPFLLIVSFTTLQILQTIQTILVKRRGNVSVTLYSISMIAWHFFWTYGNILLCGSIQDEVEKILAVASKMETLFSDNKTKESEQIRLFINVVKENFPNFSAANFFDVNRKTVFQIFNTIVTFLVVMLQFEYSQDPNAGTTASPLKCVCNKTK
ncbi:gustatory receptor 68a-like [Zophobas morio]|uniref:gustatory receptor 68a-like n=1 Tax=Zophobas morio TaxID=2755281 RepID=UPI003082A389